MKTITKDPELVGFKHRYLGEVWKKSGGWAYQTHIGLLYCDTKKQALKMAAMYLKYYDPEVITKSPRNENETRCKS